MDISPAPQEQNYGIFRTLKQKTSSIWSPHLQPDRRATRHSVWDPPSVSWSADSGMLGKRNAQVVLFVLGFIFPFGMSFSIKLQCPESNSLCLAWMVAAVLPLPANPEAYSLEAGDYPNQYGSTHPAFRYEKYVFDETKYESARWWRNLNRVMSVIGLLIIGAVVALAIIGVREGWGASS